MNTPLSEALAELPGLTPAQLRACWRDVWRQPAPSMGPDFLRRGIAWRLQARVHGSLSRPVQRELDKAIRRIERTGEAADRHALSLKTGTRLVRDWNGKTYHVLVCDEGFEHDGRRYDSLSQIARAITGAHWSGPRFFGVKTMTTKLARNAAA